jgi:fluoroacetyl-CoA thioesterase
MGCPRWTTNLNDVIPEGSSASIALTVSDADTAIALGSGDVAVLGTPRVVALCEEAAVAAIAGLLPEGETTVGTSIRMDHLSATGVGGTVTATATVAEVDDKKIAFVLIVEDRGKAAARGTHTRFVVNRRLFDGTFVG